RGRDTLLEKRVGELLATTWTVANESVQLGVHDEPGQAFGAVCSNSRLRHAFSKLGARQMRPVSQNFGHHFLSCANYRRFHAKLAIVVAEGRFDPWAGQGKHPPDVGRRDVVPGRAKDVRAKNAAAVDLLFYRGVGGAAHPLAESPL